MKNWGLMGIVLLALLLRVVALNKFPAGFTPDEASFGYDAYSILKTGKDQWGQPFPLVLESFGDYKPPLYAYLTIPFVATLGLEKYSVRLPNATVGTLAVLVTYFLVREISKDKHLPLLASLFLAISPWHVMMSRGAFEANLTTLLLPLGLLLLFKGIKESKYLNWSALVFGLNLFSYHAARLVTPLVLLIALIVYRKELLKDGVKKLVLPGLIFAVFSLAALYTLVVGGAATRAADVNIFKGSLVEAAEERIVAINSGMPQSVARLIHNKYLVSTERLVRGYVQYFSPRFFFTNGPAEGTYGMIPGRGTLYLIEAVLLIGFLLSLSKKEKKERSVLIAWLLLAPIPAALATGPGFAGNRSIIMQPAIAIALAIGALYWLGKYKKQAKILTLFYSVALLLFFAFFAEDYFLLSPAKNGQAMLSGNLEAAQYTVQNVAQDRQVIVSRRLSEPHIYIAFAEKLEPQIYQEATKAWDYKKQGLGWVDQLGEYQLGNYIFKNVDYNSQKESGAVLAGKPEEFNAPVVPLKIFYYPNGDPALYIVDTDSQ